MFVIFLVYYVIVGCENPSLHEWNDVNIFDYYCSWSAPGTSKNCSSQFPCTMDQIIEKMNNTIHNNCYQMFIHFDPGLYNIPKNSVIETSCKLLEFRVEEEFLYSEKAYIIDNDDSSSDYTLVKSLLNSSESPAITFEGISFKKFKRSLGEGFEKMRIVRSSFDIVSVPIVKFPENFSSHIMELYDVTISNLVSKIASFSGSYYSSIEFENTVIENYAIKNDELFKLRSGGNALINFQNFTIREISEPVDRMFTALSEKNTTYIFDGCKFHDFHFIKSICNVTSNYGEVLFICGELKMFGQESSVPGNDETSYFNVLSPKRLAIRLSASEFYYPKYRIYNFVGYQKKSTKRTFPIEITMYNQTVLNSNSALLSVSVSDHHSLNMWMEDFDLKDLRTTSEIIRITGSSYDGSNNAITIKEFDIIDSSFSSLIFFRDFVGSSETSISFNIDELNLENIDLLHDIFRFDSHIVSTFQLFLDNSKLIGVRGGSFGAFVVDDASFSFYRSRFEDFSGIGVGQGGLVGVQRKTFDEYANRTKLIFLHNTVKNIHSNDRGGAIYGYNIFFQVENSSFSGCSSVYGGAIYSYRSTYLDYTHGYTHFFNNTATFGGAVMFDSVVKVILYGTTTFTSNGALKDGGAMFLSQTGKASKSGEFIFLGLYPSFCNNTASGFGGAIFVKDLEENFVVSSRVEYNNAGNDGGGIYYLEVNSPYLPSTIFEGIRNNMVGEIINNVRTLPSSLEIPNSVHCTKENDEFVCSVNCIWKDQYSQIIESKPYSSLIVVVNSPYFSQKISLLQVKKIEFRINPKDLNGNDVVSATIEYMTMKFSLVLRFPKSPDKHDDDKKKDKSNDGFSAGEVVGIIFLVLFLICFCCFCGFCFILFALVIIVAIYFGLLKNRSVEKVPKVDEKELGTYLEL